MDVPHPQEETTQDLNELEKTLAADRWLAHSGLVTESVQHNLVLHGYLASSLVDEVEVCLDVQNKCIHYYIYMRSGNFRRHKKFMAAWAKYANPTTLWQKWRKLRLFKKSVYMNVDHNLRRMVADYLPGFVTEIEVLPYGQKRQYEPSRDPNNN